MPGLNAEALLGMDVIQRKGNINAVTRAEDQTNKVAEEELNMIQSGVLAKGIFLMNRTLMMTWKGRQYL